MTIVQHLIADQFGSHIGKYSERLRVTQKGETLTQAPLLYLESVAIMEALIDDGRDVTMLTNFAADTFREARKLYPFLDLPRGVTVSGEVGLIKPDLAIYEKHSRDFGLEPAHTLRSE